MTKTRYVTVRHSSSGRWCLEAPHPVHDVPQPFYLEGVPMTAATKRAMADALAGAGCSLIRNQRDKQLYVYRGGVPLAA